MQGALLDSELRRGTRLKYDPEYDCVMRQSHRKCCTDTVINKLLEVPRRRVVNRRLILVHGRGTPHHDTDSHFADGLDSSPAPADGSTRSITLRTERSGTFQSPSPGTGKQLLLPARSGVSQPRPTSPSPGAHAESPSHLSAGRGGNSDAPFKAKWAMESGGQDQDSDTSSTLNALHRPSLRSISRATERSISVFRAFQSRCPHHRLLARQPLILADAALAVGLLRLSSLACVRARTHTHARACLNPALPPRHGRTDAADIESSNTWPAAAWTVSDLVPIQGFSQRARAARAEKVLSPLPSRMPWGVGCGVWGVGCGLWGVGRGAWGVVCGASEARAGCKGGGGG